MDQNGAVQCHRVPKLTDFAPKLAKVGAKLVQVGPSWPKAGVKLDQRCRQDDPKPVKSVATHNDKAPRNHQVATSDHCLYSGTRDGWSTPLVRTCFKYLADMRGIGMMTSEPMSSTCALLVLKVMKLRHNGHNECTYVGGRNRQLMSTPHR